MTAVFQLLRHIWLGFVHVLAILFLPSHRSFETVNELTESGYTASYLDHCRTQHNFRFGTLAYSLVLACSIAFVTITVQILYPEQFNEPVYAATLTVNSSNDDNDGSCDTLPGDCTLREAIFVAGPNDIIDFLANTTIIITSQLGITDSGLNITNNGRTVTIDCNNAQSFDFAFSINADSVEIDGLTIQNCKSAVNIQADDVTLQGLTIKSTPNGIFVGQVDKALIDGLTITGGANVQVGMTLRASTNATVRNTTISECSKGIILQNEAAGVTMSNNSIYGASWATEVTSSSDVTIDDNNIGVDGYPLGIGTTGGILVNGISSDVTISNNTFRGIGVNGSILASGSGHVISNNTIEDDSASAITVDSGSQLKIFGNTISRSSDYAIRLQNNTTETSIGVDEDGSGAANLINDAVGGIEVSGSNQNHITGNTIEVTGVNPALNLDTSDETVFTQNTITADVFAQLVDADTSTISENTMTDDDANTNGTNIQLQNSTANLFDNNTITVSDADVITIEDSSHSNIISNNTIDGQNVATAGIEVTDSNDNTFVGNSIANIPGNAFALMGTTAGTVIGLDETDTGAANTFLGNTTDVSVQDGVTATLVRGNTTNNDEVDAMIEYTATAPIASPILTRHTTKRLEGTAAVSSTIDVYGRADANANIAYITGTTADAAGIWSINQAALADNSDLYVTASTAADGTSKFITATQPDTTAQMSDLTATVLGNSSARITWTTNVASTSKVNYGTNSDALNSSEDDPAGVTSHEMTLTGLNANTTYYYQVRSADTNNTLNYDQSDVQSFTTEKGDFVNTLPTYAKTVASTVTVETAGDPITVTGDGTTTTQLPYMDLQFVFTDSKDRLDDYRLHFVLREAKKKAQDIVNKKKAFNAAGQAQFLVKKQQLSLEKTYAVYSGVIKDDNTYLNNDGLAKRFTFTLLDVPQLLYPSAKVIYRMPEQFIVTSKAPSVTVYVDDSSGNELMHCTAIMVEGIGSCAPPFHVPSLGNYSIRLTDARGGSISQSILISDLAPNDTITTDQRSSNFYKRIIFGGQPTFSGLVGTGNTIELRVPQINGAMQAKVTGNSWMFTLKLTTLPFGPTNVAVTERRPDGTVVNQNTYLIYRAHRPVVPAIISPTDGSVATVAPTIQLVGPNDHTVELRNSDGVRLSTAEYVNGGQVFDLSQWYTALGKHTITVQNRNQLNIPSKAITFTFTITSPRTTVTPPTENETTPTPTEPTESTDSTSQPDTDEDGLSDVVEDQLGTDPQDPDSDNDGVSDSDEVEQNDGVDSDGDGLSDVVEDQLGTDPEQSDSDGDGVSDTQEIEDATDPTDENNHRLVDSDDDGLADTEEPDYGTDPNDPDTDDDTMYDGDEVVFGSDPLSADGDEDGLTDPQEYTLQTDPRISDTDSDSVLDGAEVSAGTTPTDFDTDDDGLSDNENRDYATLALDADTDDDRLLDGEEVNRGCDPLDKDSDDDDIDDLVEALAGTDCTSTDNLWSNLTGIETYLQELARTVYDETGTESFDYPLLTQQLVTAEADLDQTLTNEIQTATTLDIIPGVDTVVSDGAVRVITRTTEISLLDWLTGIEPTSTDSTYVLVSGTVSLPDSVKGQSAYVLVTFFSAPVVKIAQVESNGQWTMTVPAELLTAGDHTAFAALEVNGTRSEQVEVAKFVINHKRKLSNTSWLIIVNVIVAVVALLIALVIHLRRKRAQQTYA